MKANNTQRRVNPWAWIPTLYTAEGIPYAIVMSVAAVMYERMGLENSEIALYTSWLYLPWVIKPFWSPVVELLRTKRWWIVSMQLVVGAAMAALAFSMNVPFFLQCSLAAFWLIAFSSATHDIAADGFYIIALTQGEQSFFVGIRTTFYRIATIFGQGLLVMLAGLLETKFTPAKAWSLTFLFVAALFAFFFLYHAKSLPRPKEDSEHTEADWHNAFRDFVETFVSFFRRAHIVQVLLFILLFRLPEALIVKICPLFMLDSPQAGGLGLSTPDLGFVQGTIGVIGLTLGGILGGIVVNRHGLRRWLWPMVMCITLPDAVYIYLAYFQPDVIWPVGVCVFFEQFGYGFGSTAYMLYLLQFSEGEHSTAHYAFCTGLMALGMMLPGMVAGYLQEHVGYLNFFIIAMVLCIVTLAVSSLIKVKDAPDDEDHPC